MAPVVPPDVRVTAIVAAGNAHVATPSWVKVNFTGTTPRLHQGEHREARPSLPSLRRVALKRYAIKFAVFHRVPKATDCFQTFRHLFKLKKQIGQDFVPRHAFISKHGGQTEQTARECAGPVVCGHELRIVPDVFGGSAESDHLHSRRDGSLFLQTTGNTGRNRRCAARNGSLPDARDWK